MALRVVLADDAALIRGALAQLLEDGGVEVLAQVGTPAQLLTAVEEHQPEVALVDIRMPPTLHRRRHTCGARNPPTLPERRHPPALHTRRG